MQITAVVCDGRRERKLLEPTHSSFNSERWVCFQKYKRNANNTQFAAMRSLPADDPDHEHLRFPVLTAEL